MVLWKLKKRSKAAFETLIGTILSYMYNGGEVNPIEIAKIGQYAENVYFGKPCGLMEQMACSVVFNYQKEMDKIFGNGSCEVLKIRKYGGIKVL